MSLRRVQEDLGELGDAAERLMRQDLSYAKALADYFPRLLDAYGGDRSLVGTFDDLDLDYL